MGEVLKFLFPSEELYRVWHCKHRAGNEAKKGTFSILQGTNKQRWIFVQRLELATAMEKIFGSNDMPEDLAGNSWESWFLRIWLLILWIIKLWYIHLRIVIRSTGYQILYSARTFVFNIGKLVSKRAPNNTHNTKMYFTASDASSSNLSRKRLRNMYSEEIKLHKGF